MKRKYMYCSLKEQGRTQGKASQDEYIPLEISAEVRGAQISVFLSDAQGRTVWRKSFHPADGDNGGCYRYGKYKVNVRIDVRDQTLDVSIT